MRKSSLAFASLSVWALVMGASQAEDTASPPKAPGEQAEPSQKMEKKAPAAEMKADPDTNAAAKPAQSSKMSTEEQQLPKKQ